MPGGMTLDDPVEITLGDVGGVRVRPVDARIDPGDPARGHLGAEPRGHPESDTGLAGIQGAVEGPWIGRHPDDPKIVRGKLRQKGPALDGAILVADDDGDMPEIEIHRVAVEQQHHERRQDDQAEGERVAPDLDQLLADHGK